MSRQSQVGHCLWAVATHLMIMALAVAAASCKPGDAGSKVDQARTAYIQGRLDEAAGLFQEALEAEPENAGALVGLANIHLDREELDQAAALFERLDALELDRRSEQLVERARQRYYRLVYDRTRGDGPSDPADPGAYEEALIGLFNMEAQRQHIDELVELFALQARRALGVIDPTQPLAPNSAYVQDATLEQLQEAQAGYRRFTERDPRLTRVLPLPDDIRAEAEAMVPALELAIFEHEFDERFRTRLRERLIQESRFDPVENVIRITFQTPEPYSGPRPEGEALDAFRDDLALTVAVEELTDLAYQVKGMERGDNRPLQLGRTPEEVAGAYAGIQVPQFDFARNGIITMEVAVPYSLLPLTGYRLEQYLEWLARREAEGTGTGAEEGTGTGTEEGTGAAGTGEGTGGSEGTP